MFTELLNLPREEALARTVSAETVAEGKLTIH